MALSNATCASEVPDLMAQNFPAVGFGNLLDLFLLGILTAQVYIYYVAFPEDRNLLKGTVLCVYAISITQTILSILDLYPSSENAVSCRGLQKPDPQPPFYQGHFWLSLVALSAVAAFVTQLLYAYRIYVITRKGYIPVLIICLSLGQLVTGGIGCYCTGVATPWAAIAVSSRNVELCVEGYDHAWGPFNVMCDLTITISMVVLLVKRHRQAAKQQTRERIARVLQIIIETGMITSIMVIFYTLAYNFFVHRAAFDRGSKIPWYLIPGLAMSKIYSNSMLALLNSRATIAGGRNMEPISIEDTNGVLTTAIWHSGISDTGRFQQASVGNLTGSSHS